MNIKINRLNILKSGFFACICMGVFLVCCNKDSGSNNNGVNKFINAKWKISDPDSEYSSFEFNKDGNYIVIENVSTGSKRSAGLKRSQILISGMKRFAESNLSPIHFGTYKIEGNTIILSGFGTINIISITAEEFCFSFVLESTGKEWNYVATTEDQGQTSSRTEMLCRTWKLNKVVFDESFIPEELKEYLKKEYGANWKAEIEKEYNEELAGSIILFSKAGTYLILYQGEDEEAGLSEWKWANKEETAIYYSWDNWKDDWEDNIVSIKDLKSTSLKMQEEGMIYEMTLVK